jgi:hypothetical protein
MRVSHETCYCAPSRAKKNSPGIPDSGAERRRILQQAARMGPTRYCPRFDDSKESILYSKTHASDDIYFETHPSRKAAIPANRFA